MHNQNWTLNNNKAKETDIKIACINDSHTTSKIRNDGLDFAPKFSNGTKLQTKMSRMLMIITHILACVPVMIYDVLVPSKVTKLHFKVKWNVLYSSWDKVRSYISLFGRRLLRHILTENLVRLDFGLVVFERCNNVILVGELQYFIIL